ncbi:MAG: preprotein translocase subunit Sec61beta [Thermoplasmata archaeon]|nr:preprotein translocase subunit Sec61beta [Candidatus Sysuiplasma acidicola]MBX8646382.1 preprotein translocase subunit Sec61beta [Candidatus Sysuiplasma acidicola]MDH2905245.1 preprotein translocase subunit Sec61beta [Methanomassiliicoccales archaeon]
MAKKKGEGFQSAAGLIRYFDAEDEKALKVNPWLVVALIIATVVIIEYLTISFPNA